MQQQQHTHTQPHNRFMALWTLSRTTRVSRYHKKHSPTHTYRGHQSSLICFIHLIRSMASSLFNSRAWQSFSTISVQVFFVQENPGDPAPEKTHPVTLSLYRYYPGSIINFQHFVYSIGHLPCLVVFSTTLNSNRFNKTNPSLRNQAKYSVTMSWSFAACFQLNINLRQLSIQ